MKRELMKENIKASYGENNPTTETFKDIANTWLSDKAVESIYNDLMRLKEVF